MNRIVDITFSIYKNTLSIFLASLGVRCRFHPSCSDYARATLKHHGWWRALKLIVWRILRCGPWHPGGVDLVR